MTIPPKYAIPLSAWVPAFTAMACFYPVWPFVDMPDHDMTPTCALIGRYERLDLSYHDGCQLFRLAEKGAMACI